MLQNYSVIVGLVSKCCLDDHVLSVITLPLQLCQIVCVLSSLFCCVDYAVSSEYSDSLGNKCVIDLTCTHDVVPETYLHKSMNQKYGKRCPQAISNRLFNRVWPS